MKVTLKIFLLVIIITGCVEPIHKSFTKLPPGIWRGVLVLDKNPVIIDGDEEYSYKNDFSGELPFNFEVEYLNEEEFQIVFINADERIVAKNITYGRDKATAKDTIIIDFPVFDTYIKAIYEDDIMEGHYYVNYKNGYRIPFRAYFGKGHRFTTLKKKPIMDISGKWNIAFEEGTKDEYPAIGEFKQEGNKVTGSILTETGDYRYLEGTIQKNKLYLSTFDAAHAFLFEAKITKEGKMLGSFLSGKHYKSTWRGEKNDNVRLTNAFELTTVTPPAEAMNFTFTDNKGKEVSLSDSRFDDKIKLIKISGTWCPNCKDESNFLLDYIKNNPSEDIEIIEISFEYYKDEKRSLDAINRYIDAMDIPWTVLYGGYANKSTTSEKFPQLSKILSYPTLVFLDKENNIQKVHTGFAGPATSQYEQFEVNFHEIIKSLRK